MKHLPRRDSASNAREIDDLQKINRKLKREVSKLQKIIAKLLSQSACEEESAEPLSKSGVECPACGKDFTTVNLGIKTLQICKSCGWKKVASP